MSGLDLAPIKARLEALPDHPWTQSPPGSTGVLCTTDIEDRDGFPYDPDFEAPTPVEAEFIAAAPTDIAALIAEVERLREGLKKLRDTYYFSENTTPNIMVSGAYADVADELVDILWAQGDYAREALR